MVNGNEEILKELKEIRIEIHAVNLPTPRGLLSANPPSAEWGI